MLLEQPFFASYASMPIAQKSLAFCFPIGVAGHLFCALMLLTASRRRLNSRTLGLLLLALLLLAATDTIYAMVVVQTFYAPGAVVDAGWIGAWLLFGVAALDGSEQVLKRRATPTTPIISEAVASEKQTEVTLFGMKLRSRSVRRNAIALAALYRFVAGVLRLTGEREFSFDRTEPRFAGRWSGDGGFGAPDAVAVG